MPCLTSSLPLGVQANLSNKTYSERLKILNLPNTEVQTISRRYDRNVQDNYGKGIYDSTCVPRLDFMKLPTELSL